MTHSQLEGKRYDAEARLTKVRREVQSKKKNEKKKRGTLIFANRH